MIASNLNFATLANLGQFVLCTIFGPKRLPLPLGKSNLKDRNLNNTGGQQCQRRKCWKSQPCSKQKEPVSKIGGRRVSTKMTRVNMSFFVMCIRNQFVHTNVDFGYLEESKMRMPSYKDYVHWSCIPSKLFFSEGSSQDNLFWPNSPVSRKVILLLIRIWATLGALPLWPRITSWWDRSKQVFECGWMCITHCVCLCVCRQTRVFVWFCELVLLYTHVFVCVWNTGGTFPVTQDSNLVKAVFACEWVCISL